MSIFQYEQIHKSAFRFFVFYILIKHKFSDWYALKTLIGIVLKV